MTTAWAEYRCTEQFYFTVLYTCTTMHCTNLEVGGDRSLGGVLPVAGARLSVQPARAHEVPLLPEDLRHSGEQYT